jgi:predicted dehydrogenase
MAEMLKAVMIGLRNHAGSLDPNKSHGLLKTFKALPDVQVVAYCEWASDQAAALAAVAQADPQARTYTQLDELLAHEEFDFAAIMLPPKEARDTALRLAELGKHQYIEKHAGRTADEVRPLLDLVRRKGVVVQVGYPWSYHPIAVEMRRLLDQEVIGRLVDLELRHVSTKFGPGLRDPHNWAFRRETEGGGMLHQQGCHWLALLRYFAQAEVRSVVALCSRVEGLILDDLEDVSTVAMELTNGAHASLRNGFLLQAVGPRDDISIVLRGTLGHMTWRPTDGSKSSEVTVVSATPEWQTAPFRKLTVQVAERPVYAGEHGYHFVNAFIQAIRTGSSVAVTLEDGLRVLEIIDASYASARTGRRVDLA